MGRKNINGALVQKLLHLTPAAIKSLTKFAKKEGTDFKNKSQDILESAAKKEVK